MAHPDGSRFWFNRRWYEYTGASPEQMEGWGWRAVHHPDHTERAFDRYRRCASGKAHPGSPAPPRQGRRVPLVPLRAIALRDSEGNITRWFGRHQHHRAARDQGPACAKPRNWRAWACSPAASRTTSTTCSPAILGNAELALLRLPPDAPVRENLARSRRPPDGPPTCAARCWPTPARAASSSSRSTWRGGRGNGPAAAGVHLEEGVAALRPRPDLPAVERRRDAGPAGRS